MSSIADEPKKTKKNTKLDDENESKERKVNKRKTKDPNAIKKPKTAFFLFMDEFRARYKHENPENKSVTNVSKAGGAEWRELGTAEKKVYQEKATELKNKWEVDYPEEAAKKKERKPRVKKSKKSKEDDGKVEDAEDEEEEEEQEDE